MTLEAYNTQYLQRHSVKAKAVLGAARGLQILGSPRDEIEGVILGILNPETDLSLKVSDCRQLWLACHLNAVVHRRH
jgi:peptide alpha-N-acetyltransferase